MSDEAVKLARDYMRMCDERRDSGITGPFVYADYPTEAQHELAAAVIAQADELAKLREDSERRLTEAEIVLQQQMRVRDDEIAELRAALRIARKALERIRLQGDPPAGAAARRRALRRLANGE